MTSNGDPEPKLSVKLVWGLLIAGAASVLLFSGGGGLRALQTASIVAALPFTIIMIFMVVCITMILSKDKKLGRRIKKKRDLYEMKDDLHDEVKDEIYDDVKDDFYEEFKDKVQDEVKKEIIEEINDEHSKD